METDGHNCELWWELPCSLCQDPVCDACRINNKCIGCNEEEEQEQTRRKELRLPNEKYCENCSKPYGYLKSHLEKLDFCAQYYMKEFRKSNVKDVLKYITNLKRTERRWQHKETGNKRDRRKEIHTQKLKRAKSSLRTCKNNFLESISRILEIPCVMCTSRFTSGINKITEDRIDLIEIIPEERKDKLIYQGYHWICSNCSKICKTNPNLLACLNDMNYLDNFDDLVGTLTYENTQEEAIGVYVPLIKLERAIYLGRTNSHTQVEPHSMIFDKFCRLEAVDIPVETSQFFSNKTVEDPKRMLNILYRDANKKMQAVENNLNNPENLAKLGHIADNVLHLSDEDSEDFLLKNIRGTKAYLTKLKNENIAKQYQNGNQNIFINIEVFNGMINLELLLNLF